ncbi:MAG: bifunctional diaminohydroxyphosphoribosylaminopyrimidine deaminase/5-amino-6-(5-phosphoribosylamino)uracil reductase RibD [Caldithrix sp.]|nr:bifunctional diaminohydroxyphosphoribosylaminopyrimidine deaminase/5-amino-6-(5-phosphoribosylamino)uracil reductase RibD [Caldithrix sp.]
MSGPSISQQDKDFMQKCFKLAQKGRGQVSPNPLVGAVVVKDGHVIGEGYHEQFGGKHAEVNAIESTSAKVDNATLYCNLEPCCHEKKKTPPCTPFIISHNIKRVVIANDDPNPQVAGKGIEQLRQAGIEVETGVLNEEGAYLNRFFFKYIKSGMPYVLLKVAQSVDGYIAAEPGKQTWLTGPEAQTLVHQLRSEYDAVLVGANTVKVDDPSLSVRQVKGRNPLRIILDGQLSSPLSAKIFNDSAPENTWIFTNRESNIQKITVLRQKKVQIVECNGMSNGNLKLEEILRYLAARGINSLLVEGGQSIVSQFLKQHLVDELIVLQSPAILGGGVSTIKMKKSHSLRLLDVSRLGDDVKLHYLAVVN